MVAEPNSASPAGGSFRACASMMAHDRTDPVASSQSSPHPCPRCILMSPISTRWLTRLLQDNMNILRDAAHLQTQLRLYDNLVETRHTLLRLRPQLRQNWIALAVAYHLSGNLREAKAVLEQYERIIKVRMVDVCAYLQCSDPRPSRTYPTTTSSIRRSCSTMYAFWKTWVTTLKRSPSWTLAPRSGLSSTELQLWSSEVSACAPLVSRRHYSVSMGQPASCPRLERKRPSRHGRVSSNRTPSATITSKVFSPAEASISVSTTKNRA